jgi:hypothetical protein
MEIQCYWRTNQRPETGTNRTDGYTKLFVVNYLSADAGCFTWHQLHAQS